MHALDNPRARLVRGERGRDGLLGETQRFNGSPQHVDVRYEGRIERQNVDRTTKNITFSGAEDARAIVITGGVSGCSHHASAFLR